MKINSLARFGVLVATLLMLPAFAADEGTQNARPAQATGDADEASLPIPDKFKAQVERSAKIGRILYQLDHAAAVATDVLHAEVDESHRENLAGYLPLKDAEAEGKAGGGYSVLFYTKDAPARIAYTVRLEVGKRPVLETDNPTIEPEASVATLIRARQTALKAAAPYYQPINPIVLPGAAIGEEGILVYLLAGTKKPHTIAMGKHFRVLVNADGDSVKSVTPLTKAIVEQSTQGPEGTEPEALMIANLVAEYPLETHVFSSLLTGIPIDVVTEHYAWWVAGDKIELMRMR